MECIGCVVFSKKLIALKKIMSEYSLLKGHTEVFNFFFIHFHHIDEADTPIFRSGRKPRSFFIVLIWRFV